jgi:PAS domain S-box-containing protein
MKKSYRVIKALPFLVLVISLSISLALWRMLDRSLVEKARSVYDDTTDTITRSIVKRLHDHEQVLLGGVGLFNTIGEVQRKDWRRYVSSLQLDQHHPGILGVGYSVWLTPAEKDANIRAVRAEGFAEYLIRPEGDRPAYTSIIYLEPFNWRNQLAFGYDMYTEAVRRAAMDKARDGGVTTIAAKIILVQETDKDKQNGMLMYAPVYRQGEATDSVEHRRRALRGFVYSPIRMNDFVYGTLGKLPQDVAFEVYADEAQTADSLLFSSIQAEKTVIPAGFTPDFTSRATVEAYGRTWSFSFRSLPSFTKQLEKTQSSFALSISIIASLLLSGITFLLLDTRNKAVVMAQKMTKELRESEERLRCITDSAHDAILMMDPQGAISYWNPAAEQIFGYRAEEALGKDLHNLLVPERYHADHHAALPEFLRTGFGEAIGRTRTLFAIRKDGQEIAVSVSLSAVSLNGAWHAVGVLRDITERLREEEALKKSEEKVRLLLNSTGEAIYGIDMAGNCTFANPSCLRMLGYADTDQLLGKNMHRLIHHSYPDGSIFPVEACSIYRAFHESCGVHRDDEVLWRADGSSFPAEYWSYPQLVNGEVTGAVVTFNDITERKQMQEEIATKNATLEREKELAHGLLKTILSENLQIQGFRTAVFYKPSDQIGGDFFDGWSDGTYAHFLLGDISGHSISASLLMAVCKGLFMTIGKELHDPAAIVAQANRTLSRMLTESGMYLTMVYAVCDIQGRILRVASAGHNPVYLYSAAARVAIDSTGPPIGWDPEDSWTVAEYPFARGDKILLYTDGVVETRSPAGEFCTLDIFAAVDATCGEEAMVRSVLNLAEDFCDGAFDDDLTLFAIGYDSPGPE